eukprot:2363115-Alexandrium_andersonii.AAC.1
MGLGRSEIDRRSLCNETRVWMKAAVCHCIAGVQHGGLSGLHAVFGSGLKCRCACRHWQHEGCCLLYTSDAADDM